MTDWKRRLKDHGLKITGKAKFVLSELHIRYVPPIFNARIWMNPEDPMALRTSPHFHLMLIFKEYGFDKRRIEKSLYFADRRFRNACGLNWPDKKIWEHVKKRYDTFKNIKKHGFDKGLWSKNPIVVVMEPFWSTRYGVKEIGYTETKLKGPEIWGGAGRCSAALVLGYDKLPCVIVKDKRPGLGKSLLDKKLKGAMK